MSSCVYVTIRADTWARIVALLVCASKHAPPKLRREIRAAIAEGFGA